MNLVIDIGNTYVKCAVFERDSIVENVKFNIETFKENVLKILKSFIAIEKIIISSVRNLDVLDVEFIKAIKPTLILDKNFAFPFNNEYVTPETLGVDRLALVSAAYHKMSFSNTLVIDAGTCITYDFIDSSNNYLGGSISPGLEMRYKALNKYTNGLPLLESSSENKIIGNSTSSCMHSGVVNGLLYEIDGIIDWYNTNYEDLTVILTGGDTNFLSKQLKSSIFANSNFLLEGLNYLLNFNLKE
jgi:type III pantothenate kinase